MIQLKKIYFIYDADGGLWNEIKYWINKNLLNKKSSCELCDISHSKLFVRFEWLTFIRELKNHYKVKVLHRNEVPQNIQDKNYQFPCVIGETENELIEILNKIAFKDYGNLKSVKELEEQFFQKLAILESNHEFDKVKE
jgi:hypothetical protein